MVGPGGDNLAITKTPTLYFQPEIVSDKAIYLNSYHKKSRSAVPRCDELQMQSVGFEGARGYGVNFDLDASVLRESNVATVSDEA